MKIQERDQDGPRKVDPVGAEMKKWESDFRKPIGRTLKLPFRNTGTSNLVSFDIEDFNSQELSL